MNRIFSRLPFFLTLKEYFDRSDILYTNNLDKKEK